MQLMGIDLGTSSVKVLVISLDGQILGQGAAEYPIRYPQPTFAEQHPADWWQATISSIHKACEADQVVPEEIAGIGLSGQMHGTVLLDGSGHLLGPAVIWPDQRSHRQVQEITELFGLERLMNIAGSPVATGFQAATLRWLQQEQEELWQRVRLILTPKDYLRWRLTGEPLTDPSDGSGTLLLDVRHRNWSDEILHRLVIDVDQLPPVVPSDYVAGQLTAEAAKELALPAGLRVIVGAADTACGMLGAGVVDDQTLLLSISTGGQLILPAIDVQVDRKGRLHTFCSAMAPESGWPGWYQMAAILSAGMSLRWLRDRVFDLKVKNPYAQMTAWAEDVPAGASGLLFLPYLAGERTPHMDPMARGMFLGLTASHGRAEMVRAVMEGVALACYDAFSILTEISAKPNRIVMAGGGARSSLWQQIVADVFQLPARPLINAEQSAFGAAILAGSGIGLLDVGESTQEWSRYGEQVNPIDGQRIIYQDLFGMFQAAYWKHRSDFQRLNILGR